MKLAEALLIVTLLHLRPLTGSVEKAKRVKKIADTWTARNFSSTEEFPENNSNLRSNVPPEFLSPSVLEHLELGRSIPGKPGADYPVLGEVPYTSFYCDNQEWPGFFADVETRCQAWHYCDIDGRQATFLCPNGTQFNQAVFICDWWFNVRCDLSLKLYSINGRLYHRHAIDPTAPHRKITKNLLDNIFA